MNTNTAAVSSPGAGLCLTASLTQEQLEQAWARFGASLAGVILRDDLGNPVRRTVGDFMLMHRADDGTIAFKSRETRNYVYLRQSGQLYVPRTNQAFNRGAF